MTVQDVVGGVSVRSSDSPSVDLYDFQRPTTLARDQMRQLTVAFDYFARQWATQLTAMVHVVANASVQSIDVERYGEYVAELPDPTALMLFDVAGVDGRGILQIPADVLLGWVGLMLGGNGSVPAPDRAFSLIESTIVGRLVEYITEDLAYSLGSLLQGSVALDSIHHDPKLAHAMGPDDFMIVVRIGIAIRDTTASTSLAFPIAALTMRDADAADGVPADLARVRLDSVPVDVSLQLDAATVGASQILGLSEGDLIRLPHAENRPLNIAVGGHTLATAAVGANGSRLACVIVTIEES